MNRIKKILKYIITIPQRLFTKCSLFSLIINSTVSSKSAILYGCRFYNSILGDYSYIGRNTTVVDCKIGKFTSIANNCNIGLANHDINWLSTSPVFFSGKNCLKKNITKIPHFDYQETIIGNDVWIGANTLIKGGIKIGNGAIIGAGSIVTKDVEPYTIVGGNPAKYIKDRFTKEHAKIIEDSHWWNFKEERLRTLSNNLDTVIQQLSVKEQPKILIQSIYAAPYRVGVFEGIQKEFNTIVFFEKQSGHKRNKKFFQNNNKLKCYFLDKKEDKKIYKSTIKKIKQFSVVIVYDYSSLSSIKLMLRCIKNKIPYLINCDGYIDNYQKRHSSIIKELIKKYFVSKAEKCLANGQVSKNYFLKYNAKEENIVIHKFSSLYDKEINYNTKENKEVLKKKLGINPNQKLFLSVGRFAPEKGYDMLLQAIKQLNNKDIQYIIIGGGNLYEQYAKYCKENNLTNIKIMDFIPKEELLHYYEAADVFVFPTKYDIWGLVINEAMSKGLPILSTNKCAAALEMVNKENGLIVDAFSVEKLREGIREFINKDESTLKKMGKESLRVAKEYSIENVYNSHIKTIKEIIERHG